MNNCYRIMNFPPMPNNLAQPCLDLASQIYQDSVPDHIQPITGVAYPRTVTRHGKEFPSVRVPRYSLTDLLGEWVSSNVTDRWANIGLSTSLANEHTTTHGAHTDGIRNFGLLYLLETSNPDQHTIFYQEPGHTILREPNTMIKNLDCLDVLESVTIQPGTWCYLNVRVLHGVENIQRYRTAVQIDFVEDPFEMFK